MTTTASESRVALRERRAQTLLAVRAFEESDPDGLLLGEVERTKATRRALAVTGLSGPASLSAPIDPSRRTEALTRRARLLFRRLELQIPGLGRMIAVSSVAGTTIPLTILVAALAGLASNALGPWRRVNLLAFPLFGLWAWNVGIYASIAIRGFMRRRPEGQRLRGRAHAGRLVGWLAGTIVRTALRRHAERHTEGGDHDLRGRTELERVEARAVTRYGALWRRAARPLLARRVSAALNLGSAAVVAGLIGGMYLRALAFEYRVGWESTLLGAGQVQFLFDVVLGPAALLMGIDVPDVGPLRIVGGDPAAGGDAATWLHLFALTSVGVVIVPRVALALYALAAATRLSHRLPIGIDDPYYKRLFVAVRGGSRAVTVRPYSYRPKQATTHALSCLLSEHFGARAVIDNREPLDYGDRLPPEPAPGTAEAVSVDRHVCRVMLFNLAQTPEPEVHGELLRDARERAQLAGDDLLVAIDVDGYAHHPPQRVAERRAAWRALVEHEGLESITIDPRTAIDEQALLDVAAAIYRPPAAVGSGS